MVAASFGIGTRIRCSLDWPFPYREKQTCNLPVPTLVFHRRLQNDCADADRKDGCRGKRPIAKGEALIIFHLSFDIFHSSFAESGTSDCASVVRVNFGRVT